MPEIILKPGREKSVKRKHPWIFSGAIQKVIGNPEPGETVKVISEEGDELGYAAFSPGSSIRARMWTFDCEHAIDGSFISNRLRIAYESRLNDRYLQSQTDAYRVVYAESDGFPGLIVDRYSDFLSAQLLSTGPEHWKDVITNELAVITGVKNIFERSDVDVRKLEGLPERKGVLSGEIPKKPIEIHENGIKFLVDVVNGQKTGFYLDQRNNRATIQKYTSNRAILNCFAYTGAFSIYALESGAKSITSIEASSDANDLAKGNFTINNLPVDKVRFVKGDVFKELRLLRDRGVSFDMIILDPPKFAPTSAQIQSASRGYKDINLLAFKLLNKNGILATFSCSGGVNKQLFQKIIADSALDAGVEAKILEYLSQASDHPIALNFPESGYLKGLICQVK